MTQELLWELYSSSKTFGEFMVKVKEALKDAGSVTTEGDDIPPPPQPPPDPKP